MFRIGWTKEQATFVAQNKIKRFYDNGGDYFVEVWDYMVELAGADGRPARLVIRVKKPPASLPQLPELGSMVPVLVNRGRTKAGFDMDDPSISRSARAKLGEQRHKDTAAERKAKFEAKLSERN